MFIHTAAGRTLHSVFRGLTMSRCRASHGGLEKYRVLNVAQGDCLSLRLQEGGSWRALDEESGDQVLTSAV